MEKVILSQEKKVNNILYIYESQEEKELLQARIMSKSNEGYQSSRTNIITLTKFTNKLTKNKKIIINQLDIKKQI